MKEMIEYGIGNTPLFEIPRINGNKILIKLERENFLGSIKARTGYWIIHDLPEEAKGKTIIESTSGNLGFALGYFCKEENINFLCLIDDSISKEKKNKLEKHGIAYKIVVQETGYDRRNSRIREANRLSKMGQYYWVNQYDNLAGIKAHETTTAQEIWAQTNYQITHCICPMGSGGTVSGIGRFFKSTAPEVKICGVEPLGSTIFGTVDAPYINVGAGLKGKPRNIARNVEVIDKHYVVDDSVSIKNAQELYDKYGLAVGVTSGMAYTVAKKIAVAATDAVIVVVAPDGRESYNEYWE